MSIPIYNKDTPTRPGLYLGLLHGRDTTTESLPDWGFDGPLIGPLKYVHTTYASDVRFEFVDATAEEVYADLGQYTELEIVEGCLKCGGKYYGDWTVYYVSEKEVAK